MKKIKQPLISVLMPTCNAGEFLVEAIESIRMQTHTNWELIVVNDGSKDKTAEILNYYKARDKRIKVLSNRTKRGIGYCLNRALRLAKGEFIARMDADDISLPYRFQKQLELLEKNPELVACGGQAAMIDNKGFVFAYKTFPTDSEVLYRMIMKMVPIQHPMLMARAHTFKKYRYNERLSTAEDVDMLFYLLSKGKISNVDRIIYQYRKSDMNNGYHNVKKTFSITLKARINAILNYGYRASYKDITISLAQFVVVTLLPSKFVVRLFEAIRYEPPFWKHTYKLFTFHHPAISFSK